MDVKLKYILFDLDETLYPTSNGLMQTISNRMRQFIIDKCALQPDEALALQKRYWNEYGTTLRGLVLERQIDPSEFLQFVHDVPLKDFLAPDPKLRGVLERLPHEKVILTNADAAHARRILDILGVADLFTRIFDVVCFEYECKPARAVYERVLQMLPARATECLLVDDLPRNLPTARELGIKTILVGSQGDSDARIETIYQVADAIANFEADTHRTGK
jgi:putative hydrolase of the HAD superfamily